MKEMIEQEIKWLEEEILKEVNSLIYNLTLELKNDRSKDLTSIAGSVECSGRVLAEKKAKIEMLKILLKRNKE